MLRVAPKTLTICTAKAMVQDSTPYTFDLTNYSGHQGGKLVVFATSEVGTATLDIKVRAYHAAKGAYYDIPGASLAQITADQTTSIDLVIHPAITAVSNRAVSQVMPKMFQVYFAVGDATTEGYTVTAEWQYLP